MFIHFNANSFWLIWLIEGRKVKMLAANIDLDSKIYSQRA